MRGRRRGIPRRRHRPRRRAHRRSVRRRADRGRGRPGALRRRHRLGTGRVLDRRGLLDEAEIVLVCVPTPLVDHAPDLSHVEDACARRLPAHLAPGRLVVLESTTYPGTTDQIVRPLLEASGLVAGRDFLLAYSPERIDPGQRGVRPSEHPEGRRRAHARGDRGGHAVLRPARRQGRGVSSCRAAELAKLLENTFRHVNIALVNELAMLCHETGIDVWEVIDAAATKPFGFMPFYPGAGRRRPLHPARSGVPRVAGPPRRRAPVPGPRAGPGHQRPDAGVRGGPGSARRSTSRGRPMKGARVLVLGVSYKPDVGDIRESPALRVMDAAAAARRQGFVPRPVRREVARERRPCSQRTELLRTAIEAADCVALLTPHRAYDLEWLAEHARLRLRRAERLRLRPATERGAAVTVGCARRSDRARAILRRRGAARGAGGREEVDRLDGTAAAVWALLDESAVDRRAGGRAARGVRRRREAGRERRRAPCSRISNARLRGGRPMHESTATARAVAAVRAPPASKIEGPAPIDDEGLAARPRAARHEKLTGIAMAAADDGCAAAERPGSTRPRGAHATR